MNRSAKLMFCPSDEYFSDNLLELASVGGVNVEVYIEVGGKKSVIEGRVMDVEPEIVTLTGPVHLPKAIIKYVRLDWPQA